MRGLAPGFEAVGTATNIEPHFVTFYVLFFPMISLFPPSFFLPSSFLMSLPFSWMVYERDDFLRLARFQRFLLLAGLHVSQITEYRRGPRLAAYRRAEARKTARSLSGTRVSCGLLWRQQRGRTALRDVGSARGQLDPKLFHSTACRARSTSVSHDVPYWPSRHARGSFPHLGL